MITLDKLLIQGFKSFDSPQTVDFTKFDGKFIFVSGDNQVEPDLGANGVGKTSIWDAICWILWGKSSVNLKAGNIKNWNSKRQCKGVLTFSNNEVKSSIERTWSPNSLKCDDVVVPQDRVDQLIGMTFEEFLYKVYISFNNRNLFASKFFDLQPADRLTLFSNVLGLERWIDRSKKAGDRANVLEKELISQQTTLAGIDGRIQTLQDTDYSKEIKQWDRDMKDTIHELNRQINAMDVDSYNSPIAEAESWLDQIKKDIGRNEVESAKVINEQDRIRQALQGKLTEMVSVQVNMDHLAKELANMKSCKGKCPYCNQKVTPEHVKKEIKRINDGMEACNEGVFNIQALIDQLQTSLDKVTQSSDELAKEYKQLNKSYLEVKDKITAYKNQQNQANREANSLKAKMIELENRPNPYADLAVQNKRKLLSALKEHEAKEDEIQKLQVKIALYKGWEKSYKEIRLFIISETLTDLEMRISNSMEKLGLVGWDVKLSVDTETKSGTIKKGFVINIQSPNTSEPVPFECFSGGEGQRLRLAGTLGFVDLLNDKSESECNIEVYDEPTTWMSEEGISDLLTVLKDRAKETGKMVFVVDHRGLESRGEFSGHINVTKTQEGSFIS